MTSLKYKAIPLIFIACSTLLLCGLGLWQLQRLEWKTALITQIETAQQQPVLGSLPELQDAKAIELLHYRKARLTGTFLHEKTLHIVGRPKEAGMGSANGFFMATPFVLEDDGRTLLVNRGFSPVGKDTKPEGVVTIEGVIRPARTKRPFSPENKPQRNVWFFEDMPAMSKAAGISLLPVVMEVTGKAEKGIYPIPNDGKIRLLNDHLYYAITWFSIAIIGIIMFIIHQRKQNPPV